MTTNLDLSPTQIGALASLIIILGGLFVLLILWLKGKRTEEFYYKGCKIFMRENEKKLWDKLSPRDKEKAFKNLKKMVKRVN